jgi:hypothetical protein
LDDSVEIANINAQFQRARGNDYAITCVLERLFGPEMFVPAKRAMRDEGLNTLPQVAVGNTNEYWSVSPMSKYGDRDQPPPWVKNLPQAVSGLFVRRANCIVSNVTTIERFRDDLSLVPASSSTPPTPPAYLRMLRTRVRQAQRPKQPTQASPDPLRRNREAQQPESSGRIAVDGNAACIATGAAESEADHLNALHGIGKTVVG